MLKYILLGFLNYGPLSGYDIKSLMDESTMHFWHAYHSQIYTTLRKLEEDGVVTSEALEDDEGKLNRRLYTITDKGQADLDRWLREPLMERSAVKEDLLVRLFFSGRRAREEVLDELRIQRRLHQQKLDYYRSLSPEHLLRQTSSPEVLAQEAVYWMTTLSFGRQYEEMYLRWLDETIATIDAL
ncbi:MAG: PadR family transcriptional regulator [Chloroflexota bacterium]|nr:PadR family transcriptional regulator [Chloroflexota bacterium]